MIYKELEVDVIKAFERLDSSILSFLDENVTYSHNYKDEFIVELQSLFKALKSKGINSLVAKLSKCEYCYPSAKAYSFHNPLNNEFVFRYIIHQESENEFRVEECRNKPISDGEKNMPF